MFSYRDRHRGYTLIELLLVLGVVSLLLTVNGKWMFEALKFSQRVRESQRQDINLKGLATQLRTDVRRAAEMKLEDDNLILNGPNRSVTTYSFADQQIFVVKKRGNQVVFQNRFALGKKAIIEWDGSELPDWISLVIRQRAHAPAEYGEGELPPVGAAEAEPKTEDLRVDFHIRTGPNSWN